MTATYNRPDFTTQSAAQYKANIDAASKVFERIAAAFAPHEQSAGSPAPDLTVVVDAGFTWDGENLNEKARQTVAGFTIPAAGTRIDRIVIDPVSGDAVRVAGTAVAGSPSATPPAIPFGFLPCARITILSTDTAITNDMIEDERVGVLPPQAMPVIQAEVTLSGTATDITGVPAWVQQIEMMLKDASTNGTSPITVQIGDSGGFEVTGYSGTTHGFGATTFSSDSISTGFEIAESNVADSSVWQGVVRLTRYDDNTWVADGQVSRSNTAGSGSVSGVKALSGPLTQIRITTTGGVNTFDGGSVVLRLN